MDKLKSIRRHGASIPNKLYFRIGEVSELVGVKPYVLRYWESEFGDIKPSKSKSGQRLYKRRDVEVLLKIKELLYDERFTINGARKRLKDLGKTLGPPVPHVENEPSEPQQLDVFDGVYQTRELPQEKQKVHEPREQHVSHESKKVFLKIKRDLESLLQVVKT